MSELFSLTNIIESLVYAMIGPVILVFIGLLVHYLDLILTGFIARISNNSIAFVFRNYITYPGTIHHELAHAAFATITGAKVVRINLFPRGTQLGSVEFVTSRNIILRGIQLSMSAIAPVVCGSVSVSLLILFVLPMCTLIWHYVIFIYILVSIFLHMTMSTQDIKNFIKGFPVCMLILFTIFLFIKPDLYTFVRSIQAINS